MSRNNDCVYVEIIVNYYYIKMFKEENFNKLVYF